MAVHRKCDGSSLCGSMDGWMDGDIHTQFNGNDRPAVRWLAGLTYTHTQMDVFLTRTDHDTAHVCVSRWDEVFFSVCALEIEAPDTHTHTHTRIRPTDRQSTAACLFVISACVSCMSVCAYELPPFLYSTNQPTH
mmetsp:Transcript_36818/g.92260  ORF Transcript_36818/g.92260 Transcript_36818/m.92260 type:complete len:135 (-) Transcript_36818:131-535(-)